jgi:N-acetylmuramoyl-L-alanine amidase
MQWSEVSAIRLATILLSGLILVLWLGALLRGQNNPAPPNQAQTPPAPAQAADQQNPGSPPAPAPARSIFVLIDAAHGGTESGAILNPTILEKDLTLAFARRLRQELNSRGMQAQLLRDGDINLTADQRAAVANSTHPALYVALHATSQGSGVRIYSAMLPSGGDDRGPFLDWQTAQSSSLSRSRWAQQQLTATIQRAGFPVRSLTAALRPLNNVKATALAVEIAPTIGNVAQLASSDYQEMVSAMLASSLVPLRSTLESPQ